MVRYDGPATFSGQLQRGRGSARHSAWGAAEADVAVYRCVIDDPRWDRQTEERDSYLAGLIRLLDLPLTPIEQHLIAFDGPHPEDIDLALHVLALLPFTGRADGAAVLRRYVLTGKHWGAAVEAVSDSGALKLPGLWDGLADDITNTHDDNQLASTVGRWEPWLTFARIQPRIWRLIEDRTPAERDVRPREEYKAARQRTRDAETGELLQDISTGGTARYRALKELGRRGEMVLLDLAEDPGLRNPAGWSPGMPEALHLLGPAAVPRARGWIHHDSTLAVLGTRILAEHGDHGDVPVLLDALRRDTGDGSWCQAEIPARGLGRLKASRAAPDLEAAWEGTVHSLAREAFLQGLQGCAPRIAEILAEEGLYDCESSVQRLACAAVPDNEPVRERLRELASDPLTPESRELRLARMAHSHGPSRENGPSSRSEMSCLGGLSVMWLGGRGAAAGHRTGGLGARSFRAT